MKGLNCIHIVRGPGPVYSASLEAESRPWGKTVSCFDDLMETVRLAKYNKRETDKSWPGRAGVS